MNNKIPYKVIAISGSTRNNSTSLQILKKLSVLLNGFCEVVIYDKINELPHFNPDLDHISPPQKVSDFRNLIQEADGVIICTPEYVFSLPGSLKNAIEWTVSTTVFSEKPVALITASSLGDKAHEALLLILKTLYARFDDNSTLLLSGARSKLEKDGEITDIKMLDQLKKVAFAFLESMTK